MILCAYFNKRKRFVIAEKKAVKLPDTMLVNLFAENVTYTLKIAEKNTNSCLRSSYTTDGCIKSIFINCHKFP